MSVKMTDWLDEDEQALAEESEFQFQQMYYLALERQNCAEWCEALRTHLPWMLAVFALGVLCTVMGWGTGS